MLAPPLPEGGQILGCQPGVCGAAGLWAGVGDGLTKTGCALGQKGVPMKLLPSSCSCAAGSTVPFWSSGH